jgi:glycerophosphoryl diester phosphodiesterase
LTRFTKQMRALDWLTARPIAHRGLHGKQDGIVENTSSAFAAAVQGNYAIECDLQITSDGEAMVFHDESLERLTSSKGRLRDHMAKELQKLPISNSKDRMQTLGELLDQVDGRVPLVIELKSHWDGDVKLVQRVLKVLEPYAGPYALMSFDPDLVEAVAELSLTTVRGITADRVTDSYYNHLPVSRRLEMRSFSHIPRTRPHFVSFAFRELPFTPVQAIRQAGHPVITWTIRSRKEQAQALRYSDQITFEGYAA